jgi:hypothetical protein
MPSSVANAYSIGSLAGKSLAELKSLAAACGVMIDKEAKEEDIRLALTTAQQAHNEAKGSRLPMQAGESVRPLNCSADTAP